MAAAAERRYAPMLATLAERLPAGEGWLFEVKWDGYRVLARVEAGRASLWSRTRQDLSERFASVARALPAALGGREAVVDGEVCALDERGRPRFSLLQRGAGALVYELFDLLELDGEPLCDRSLAERRRLLEGLLEGGEGEAVRLSETFAAGEELLAAVRRERLEGVVAKRPESPYRPGRRSRDWLKVKARERQELVIAGYTRGAGRRARSLGALVLAVRSGGELVWAGNCGTGFTEAEAERLLALLRPLERPTAPLARVPRMPRVPARNVTWVEPALVCEVEFAEWTSEGRLRAPSYRGLREDKLPAEVRRERPVAAEIRRGRRVLVLRNLDKVYWPAEGITKGDLLDYYQRLAPVLVPHLRDRPLTLVRYPDGIAGPHFFQKEAPSHRPAWVRTRRLPTTSRDGGRRAVRFVVANDELSLLWLVSMGCVDLNPTLSRADRPERPDFVLFDLDPAHDAGFREAVRVALLVKQLLDGLGLVGFPKTSGAGGLHVLVPIARRSSFETTRGFVRAVGSALARTRPDLVTEEWAKDKRSGVLIDAGQNRAGATTASVYSVRPLPGAPVSTPLAWDELSEDLDPRSFTMAAVLDRVERRGDLLAGALSLRQPLARALAALA